jgi:hypothetical protein
VEIDSRPPSGIESRVDRDIDQREREFRPVHAYRPGAFGNVDRQVDVHARRAGEDVADGVDGCGRMSDDRIERLPP